MNNINKTTTLSEIESITLEAAAKIIGVCPKTVYNWRYRHKSGERLDLPKFYRNTNNGQLRVRVSELKNWVDRLEKKSNTRRQGRPRKSK